MASTFGKISIAQYNCQAPGTNVFWHENDIINGVEEAYGAGLKSGVSNATFSYTYKGEKISIFINKDGNLTTAAGSYKFDASYFGR